VRTIRAHIPLDEEGFLRRQCPFCARQFKIIPPKDQLVDGSNKCEYSYMIEEEGSDETSAPYYEEQVMYCPYCGQSTQVEDWFTDEQRNYFKALLEQEAIEMINEDFIKPMKRRSRSALSKGSHFKMEWHELKTKTVQMSPEKNDMRVFVLPCCNQKIKINDNWQDTVCCVFCGFAHSNTQNG